MDISFVSLGCNVKCLYRQRDYFFAEAIVSATTVRTAIATAMSWGTGGIMLLLLGSSQCCWQDKISFDINWVNMVVVRKTAWVSLCTLRNNGKLELKWEVRCVGKYMEAISSLYLYIPGFLRKVPLSFWYRFYIKWYNDNVWNRRFERLVNALCSILPTQDRNILCFLTEKCPHCVSKWKINGL